VLPDGTVGEVKVTRSLDAVFGLDLEAIRPQAVPLRSRHAVREPVAVLVSFEKSNSRSR